MALQITVQLKVESIADLEKLTASLRPWLLNTSHSAIDNGVVSKAVAPPQSSMCPLHPGVELKTFSKHGRSWKAHKTPEGWCNGK
jgi:hypothetical protein